MVCLTFYLLYQVTNVFFLRFFDYVLIAVAIGAVFVIKFYGDNQDSVIYGAISLTVTIFLFYLNRNSIKEAKKADQKQQLGKTKVHTSLLSNNSSVDNNTIILARTKAFE